MVALATLSARATAAVTRWGSFVTRDARHASRALPGVCDACDACDALSGPSTSRARARTMSLPGFLTSHASQASRATEARLTALEANLAELTDHTLALALAHHALKLAHHQEPTT